MKFALVTALVLAGCGSHENHGGTPPAPTPDPEDPQLHDDAAADGPRDAMDLPLNDAVADFRGLAAVSQILDGRMMHSGTGFSLDAYLGGRNSSTLGELLGFEVGEGLRAEFRNGKANALNMVLWHLTLSSFSRDVAARCDPELEASTEPNAPRIDLSDDVAAALEPLCAWPDAEARTAENVHALWDAVLAADAPEAEFDELAAFYLDGEPASMPAQDAIASMLTTMLYSPHFLIRK